MYAKHEGVSQVDLTERMVESKTIFEGKIVRVTLDQA